MMTNVTAALLVSALTACATLGTRVEAVKDGTVTCLKSDEPAIKALGLQLVVIAAGDLFSGKSVDEAWYDVETTAELGARTRGIAVAACAFDDTIKDLEALLHPSFIDPLLTGRAALAHFESVHGVTAVVR